MLPSVAPLLCMLLQHMVPPSAVRLKRGGQDFISPAAAEAASVADGVHVAEIGAEGHVHGPIFLEILEFCLQHRDGLSSLQAVVPLQEDVRLAALSNDAAVAAGLSGSTILNGQFNVAELLSLFFSWVLSRHYTDPVLSHQAMLFCVRHARDLAVCRVLRTYYPLLLKVVAMFPMTNAAHAVELTAVVFTPQSTSVRELVHSILDMPLVCATIEFHRKLLRPDNPDSQERFAAMLKKVPCASRSCMRFALCIAAHTFSILTAASPAG
jgi:hypothetical protein